MLTEKLYHVLVDVVHRNTTEGVIKRGKRLRLRATRAHAVRRNAVSRRDTKM